ncbi:MAG: lysine--tRNA ligase [Candidatus Thiodiazotropha sp. (ex. Lucinisca nassula)]|nr:lysine--tRNA ligase [Candidatus Thiodiazotropha sp. (ex. Lucinisca nassula)]MBW9275514.1 lysine--tRNA ligase [Candidatus Thiodiazotropha sp. (ex. Lucinisca nassula)]PUB86006.1 MAG: lysine--tRNA ligase [gamma proteobacterium symbiont of Ctena orbiculata]PUB90913.1 MAG: lysine--tRNA ligase [gamma proteobacterium symbiont of Ctena orbiculata]
MNDETQDENKLIAQRREKLQQMRDNGNAFPNDFRRNSMAGELHAEYGEKSGEELESLGLRVRLAGRMMSRRVMGKASFAHLQDMSGRMQLFVQRDALDEGVYNTQFKKWDIGDIIGAEGVLFKTKTGELSVKVDSLRLLTKALRPLPEKFHGLSDQEIRYRQRYVDLIMNEASRNTFRLRTRIVQFIRNYLDQRGFLEVETPMMQVIPGGATARPFATRHNALDMDMFLRIAPELYLKRLVVGGFERVYEINRNFRNEGLSTRHNPEFTMLEFYEAYADYNDLMDLTEAMLRGLCQEVLGGTEVSYQGERYDFGSPFQRMTVKESICHFNPDITAEMLDDEAQARTIAERMEIPLKPSYGLGKIQIEIFEKSVEHRLMNPTFITAYPTEVSPLARRNDDDPFVTDRFEFFVGGREIANGFSELNDAEDQAERFRKQVQEKEAGDDEAMHYDADYVRALEHGMPPTAGEGIGIDRLVMLLTDSPSIRDVLLFPHMRPE